MFSLLSQDQTIQNIKIHACLKSTAVHNSFKQSLQFHLIVHQNKQ